MDKQTIEYGLIEKDIIKPNPPYPYPFGWIEGWVDIQRDFGVVDSP